MDGKLPQHKALLVASSQVAESDIKETLKLAQRVFGEAKAIKQREVEESGWPRSCNALFRVAAEHVRANYGEAFYWCEPDVVPLCAGWLDALEAEYRRGGKPFLGVIYPWINATKKRPHLTGCAIYPPDIARYNPFVLGATREPWDVTRPELTLKHVRETRLMHHDWRSRQPQVPWDFPTQESLRRIPKEAVVYHSSKSGDLITRLREQRHQVSLARPTLTELFLKTSYRQVRALLRGGSSYYHSGNLGDIVYALYAIKLHGGGDLYIGPQQAGTSPCAVPVSREQFELALPLLKRQDYLHKVEFTPKHPNGSVKYDLNTFRNRWDDFRVRYETGINNLCEMHCYTLGVRHLMKQDDPWLDAGEPIWTGKIIIHRSARYRANGFPWAELVKRYRKNMLFVGLESEHQEFTRNCGKVAFYKVVDFEELARVIAGGVCGIFNQSFPLSLALGVGQRALVEEWPKSPDCRFERESYAGVNELKKFERWVELAM